MKIYYITKKRTIDLSPSRIMEVNTTTLMALAPMALANELLGGGIELAGDFMIDLAITSPIHGLYHLMTGQAVTLNCHPTLTSGMLQQLSAYFPHLIK